MNSGKFETDDGHALRAHHEECRAVKEYRVTIQSEEVEMDIGDIAVVKAGTGNPYKSGQNIIGEERSRALGRFLRGLETPEHEFWHIHPSIGCRKVTEEEVSVDPDVVDYYWDEDGNPVDGRR